MIDYLDSAASRGREIYGTARRVCRNVQGSRPWYEDGQDNERHSEKLTSSEVRQFARVVKIFERAADNERNRNRMMDYDTRAARAADTRPSGPRDYDATSAETARATQTLESLRHVAAMSGITFAEALKNYRQIGDRPAPYGPGGYQERLGPSQTEADYKHEPGLLEKFFQSDEYCAMARDPSGPEYQRFLADPGGCLEDWHRRPQSQQDAVRTAGQAVPAFNPVPGRYARHERAYGDERFGRGDGQQFTRQTCDEALRLATTDPDIISRFPPERRYQEAIRRIRFDY